MRPSLLATLLAFAAPALAVSFISPPPASGGTGDFGANPVYAEGSAIQVAWTDTDDTGIPFSVVVFQVDLGGEIPPSQAFEYVVHNGVNLTSSNWVVATAKDLEFSNVFVLSVFFQGDSGGRALSHWFNISSKSTKSTDEAQRPAQTVTVITNAPADPTGSSSSTATSTTLAATQTTLAATGTPLAAANSNDDGSLSTAAKIGLAVGGVAVLVLGVAVGWLWSRRNRRGREQHMQVEPAMDASLEKAQEAVVFEKALDTAAPHELYGEVKPYELAGNSRYP